MTMTPEKIETLLETMLQSQRADTIDEAANFIKEADIKDFSGGDNLAEYMRTKLKELKKPIVLGKIIRPSKGEKNG